jgi:tetratricopeptide (TPR) repeat protein
MNKHLLSWLCIFAFACLGNTGVAFAAGGGSMGAVPSTPSPKKTPQQLAVDNYNQGIKARDKAHEHEEALAAAIKPKEQRKLQKKITKQYKRAAKKYRTAIKHEPRLYQAHGSLGYALKQLGDYEDAMVAYDEALQLKPEYTPAIEYRAEAYLELGRLDEVKEAHSQLKYRDRGHQKQLEAAIAQWLKSNDRSEDNGAFFDWASRLTSDG